MKRLFSIRDCIGFCLFLFLVYGFKVEEVHYWFTPKVKAVTIGDPQHPENLPQELQDAYNKGVQKIIIKPGRYILLKPANDGRSLFMLNGWKDVTISAYNTTLILTDMEGNHDAFRLEGCANVTFEGGTISQTKEPAYQGLIMTMGKDSAGNVTADWLPDKGYPFPEANAIRFPSGLNVADGKTKKLKTGVPDYYDAGMTAIGNSRFRIAFNKPAVHFEIGDVILGRNGNSPYKFFLSKATNCTIKDVTMMRNGFSAIREDGGGNNHILHCTWTLGPKPQGAEVDPLVSCTADGFHSTNTNPGTDIEDCIFQGILLDDPIAIHGSFTPVISGSGNSFVCPAKIKDKLVIGHPLRFTNEKGFIADAKAIAVKDNGDTTLTITLDKSINVPANTKFSDLLQCGQGSKILRCKIGGTRSRGVLLKGDNGLIKDNIFENCGMAAISLGPEFYWNEANYTQNITIAGNTFIRNGNSGGGGGVIFIHGEGAIGNKNIIIKNNRMDANLITNISLNWVDRVAITGNSFKGTANWPAIIKQTNIIAIKDARNIKFSNNKVSNVSVYKPDVVAIGDNVDGVIDNNQKGIKHVSR